MDSPARSHGLPLDAWHCPACGQSNGQAFEVCWNCGTGLDGSPASAGFVRDDVPTARQMERELRCLRCNQAMVSMGELRFHEGSQAAPFLLGNLGELFVHRTHFEGFGCEACGKVELFLPPPIRR